MQDELIQRAKQRATKGDSEGIQTALFLHIIDELSENNENAKTIISELQKVSGYVDEIKQRKTLWNRIADRFRRRACLNKHARGM